MTNRFYIIKELIYVCWLLLKTLNTLSMVDKSRLVGITFNKKNNETLFSPTRKQMFKRQYSSLTCKYGDYPSGQNLECVSQTNHTEVWVMT